MEKNIIIKEIKNDGILNEYLVYYVIGTTKVEAYIAYDKNELTLIVTELAVKHFEDEGFKPSIKKIKLNKK